MRRLFSSYKFYGTVLGTLTGFLGNEREMDSGVLIIVIGLWITLIAGQAWKDASIIKANGKG